MSSTLAQFGVPPLYARAKLTDFSEPIIGKALPKSGDYSLLILGLPGTGKTHLSVALLRELLNMGVANQVENAFLGYTAPSARFTKVGDVLSEIKASFDNQTDGPNERFIIRQITRYKVLVLDDVGSESLTAWGLSVFLNILDKRVNAMLTTIITTNLSLAQFHGIEPRIASRLGGMNVLELVGQDRRLRRRQTV